MNINRAKPKHNLEVLKRITILYVEDDEEILQQLSLFLAPKVGILYTALDGEQGLELYEKYRPDVVITDIRMPVMDGLELAKIIRERDQDVPIIVTTAFNEQEYFLKSIDIGIDKYVLKPTDPYSLLDVIIKSVVVLVQKREIELNNRYIRFILDANPSFMMTTSKNELEYINKTFLNFLGYSTLEDFKRDNKNLAEFFLKIEGIPYPDQEKQHWLQHMMNDPDKHVLVYLKDQENPKGDPKIFLVTCNGFPELGKYVFSFTDVTAIEVERVELKKQSITDALTGVFNRKKLIDALHVEISRTLRYKTPLSLIMFDIDCFKDINDNYGHNTGDYILQEVSKIVSEDIRDTDTFARWGGDEFLILTPETALNSARHLADKLNLVIKKSRFRRVKRVTGSFGVTQFKENDDMGSFINRADEALYRAKKGGRGRVEI